MTPWWEPLRPVGPDLLIKALAGGSPKGALRIRHVQIFNSTAYSKACVLYDTFDIFVILVARRRSQWQYLVVRRVIFSERVVIFETFVDWAWMWGRFSAAQPGPPKISGRLLQSILARVLTFFNRFLEMTRLG